MARVGGIECPHEGKNPRVILTDREIKISLERRLITIEPSPDEIPVADEKR